MGCYCNKCCCCVDLRTGCIIIAVLGLIGSFSSFYSGIVWGIVGFVAAIVAHGCLLYGAIKYHKVTTLVYLVMEMLFIIFYVVLLVLTIVFFAEGTVVTCWKNWDGGASDGTGCAVVVGIAVTILLVYVALIAFSIYFWVCVYSFYQDVKRNEITSPA